MPIMRIGLRLAAAVCRRLQYFPGRWRVVRWTLGQVRLSGASMAPTTVTTVHGFKFTCDLSDWIGQYVFVTASYEEPTAALMAQVVRPGDLVVDVGANVGFFTLLLSRLVGKTGRVIAFEPMPHALDRLRAHVSLNRCENVTIRDCALGSSTGTEQLYLGPRHHTSIASMQPREGAQTVEVACRTLDDELQGEAVIRCMKIDAEGWEPQVLAGARRVLERDPAPFLIAEVSDSAWFGSLVAKGFQGFAIGPDGLQRIVDIPKQTKQFNAFLSKEPLPPHITIASS
jgi:FkbM family methyltransferase